MSARPKHITSANWLREELKEWAKWYTGHRTESEDSGDGYSSTTVLGRAVAGHIQAPMTSCIPHGVEPPRDLQRICHAMIRLLPDPHLGWYVSATRCFYLSGEDIAAVMAQYHCGRRNAFILRERGEDALRAFLRA